MSFGPAPRSNRYPTKNLNINQCCEFSGEVKKLGVTKQTALVERLFTTQQTWIRSSLLAATWSCNEFLLPMTPRQTYKSLGNVSSETFKPFTTKCVFTAWMCSEIGLRSFCESFTFWLSHNKRALGVVLNLADFYQVKINCGQLRVRCCEWGVWEQWENREWESSANDFTSYLWFWRQISNQFSVVLAKWFFTVAVPNKLTWFSLNKRSGCWNIMRRKN